MGSIAESDCSDTILAIIDVEKTGNKGDHLFCEDENSILKSVHTVISERLDALEDDKKYPRGLKNIAIDAWNHVLETISDYIEDIESEL